MKSQNFKITLLALIGISFLSVSFVFAETAEEYYSRSLTYGRQGNLSQAISDCTKALELDNDFADAYYNRALAYFNKEEYKKALADVSRAKELGCPVDPEFLNTIKKASGS